jgi:amidase
MRRILPNPALRRNLLTNSSDASF